MTSNSLKLLMGDYNSDSETEDKPSESPSKHSSVSGDAVTPFVHTTSWTQCIDKATGFVYYWHPETKEVTWDIPTEYQLFLDQNAATLADSNSPHMWQVCYTDTAEDGDVPQRYYVNEYTRIVSWDKPVGFVESADDGLRSKDVDAQEKGISPASGKNVIKRRKVKQKPALKSENPFSKPTEAENVKIELISSFGAESDSSETDDTEPPTSKPLKLVATDYSSDSELANNQTHQSSSESPEILCAIIPKAAKQPAPSERCASVPKDDKPVDESEHISKKSGNTFASIIMGGRSPEQSDQTPNVGAAEAVNIVSDNRSVQSDVRPMKTMKRKRRIEFITTVPDDAESQQIAKVAAGGKSVTATADVKNMYENFKRSHVEFVDKSATCADTDVKVQPSASPSPSLATHAAGLDELREVIEAKLKFLCDGRPDVSAVQAISIQLETLVEAFNEGALQPAYLNKWLDGIAADLQTLEAGAAPPNWKCLWNRENAQYCYVHQRSGRVSWEYPTTSKGDGDEHNGDDVGEGKYGSASPSTVAAVPSTEDERIATPSPPPASKPTHAPTSKVATPVVRRDDDAMDICTTPPPSFAEPLKSTHPSGEPRPPGTNDDEAHSITAELASFYSVLADIESTTSSATDAVDAVDDPKIDASMTATKTVSSEDIATADAAAAAEAKKKKKKKAKKMEPWRSGNLETWINKWAKAQQEMDD